MIIGISSTGNSQHPRRRAVYRAAALTGEHEPVPWTGPVLIRPSWFCGMFSIRMDSEKIASTYVGVVGNLAAVRSTRLASGCEKINKSHSTGEETQKLTAAEDVTGALAHGDAGKTCRVVAALKHLVLLALLERDVGVTTMDGGTVVVATVGDGNGEAGEDEDSERLDGKHFDCWRGLVGLVFGKLRRVKSEE
jgi:hypothetical protein